jgi:hypothetical protein
MRRRGAGGSYGGMKGQGGERGGVHQITLGNKTYARVYFAPGLYETYCKKCQAYA